MTHSELLDIEAEICETESLEEIAAITDLPDAPPKKRALTEIDLHQDVPAVDVVVDVDVDVDIDAIVVADVDVDVDVDVDTPHIDSPNAQAPARN